LLNLLSGCGDISAFAAPTPKSNWPPASPDRGVFRSRLTGVICTDRNSRLHRLYTRRNVWVFSPQTHPSTSFWPVIMKCTRCGAATTVRGVSCLVLIFVSSLPVLCHLRIVVTRDCSQVISTK